MHSSSGYFAAPLRAGRSGYIVVCLSLALLATGVLAATSPVRAAAPAPLKAVFIVGAVSGSQKQDLDDAESLATQAESYGMDVRRVYFPHATWENVMANIQGANLVYYAGHGYGWPSPYTKVLTESRQDGIGINAFDGSSSTQYKYYGAAVIRANWVLAPNAIVFLNHGCYTAGNGEPGTAVPSWDTARQRVDNFASGFLAAGARAVFAYNGQRYNRSLTQLLTTDRTIAEIFETPGPHPTPDWGWIGWDPRKFDSVRTPGATNYLDPHVNQGFYRAVSGDLSMTAADWRSGPGNNQPPSMTNFDAQTPGMNTFAPSENVFFTPNGDGVTDTVTFKFNVDREAFVDMEVKNESGDVVRNLTAWSRGGPGSGTWNGKNNAGSYVPDGTYTVRATPHNRAGTEGNTQSVDVDVFTVMKSPAAAPSLFYPADGDTMTRTTTLSVNLQSPATFWWKVADKNGNVVRTFVNGVNTGTGQQTQQWDGKDGNGNYVADGTYYSVTTTQTAGGTYSHSMPVDVRAFRATTTAVPPFTRGTKAKFTLTTAEPLSARPKVRVWVPGLAVKTYSTTTVTGGWTVTVSFPATGQAGQVQLRVQGTDNGAQFQYTDYFFALK